MRMLVFTDVSVDPQLKTGFGAYLAMTETDMNMIGDAENPGEAISKLALKVKQFASTSSTQLEIETILWALQELTRQQPAGALVNNITVYTDSQGITDLPRRRTGLEQADFTGAGKNKVLKHAGLYRDFYRLHDELGFELTKLKGHSKRDEKGRLDEIFSCVDRATRKALRTYLQQTGKV